MNLNIIAFTRADTDSLFGKKFRAFFRPDRDVNDNTCCHSSLKTNLSIIHYPTAGTVAQAISENHLLKEFLMAKKGGSTVLNKLTSDTYPNTLSQLYPITRPTAPPSPKTHSP